jgi:hypothetical protein
LVLMLLLSKSSKSIAKIMTVCCYKNHDSLLKFASNDWHPKTKGITLVEHREKDFRIECLHDDI